MIEINLVPDVKQELLRAERVRAVVISGAILAGIISLGIVALLAFYIYAVQAVRGGLADDSITKGSEQLAGVEDLSKVLTIQNQLSKISELNDAKKINSRIFDVLFAVTPPAPNEVQISNLTINADQSQISLEGQTRAFDALEIFKKTIDGAVITFRENDEDRQVKLATNISATDISYGEDTNGVKVLRFNLRFTYAEELFSPATPTSVIKLINEGNVTDSYLGIPKSVFAPRAADTPQSGGTQ